jgi:hypothetical protein
MVSSFTDFRLSIVSSVLRLWEGLIVLKRDVIKTVKRKNTGTYRY